MLATLAASAVTALAAVHAAAALVPSLQFQLITFVLYVLMYPTTSLASTALVAAAPRQLGYRRSSIFSIGTVYVARVFGLLVVASSAPSLPCRATHEGRPLAPRAEWM